MKQNQNLDLDNDSVRLEFLKINYQLIAAVGWQGYLESGRGVVLIDSTRATYSKESGVSPRQRWLLGTTPGFFLGEGDEAFQTLMNGSWPDAETTRRVANYDPTQTVITLIGLGGERGDFIVQGLSSLVLPPPVCFEQMRSYLDEFQI
jgi:hypothetical protein